MRFEIRAGGAFLILIGLLGLSGGVFALGLIAGYEMARQNQPDSSQVASVFPVPSAPAAEASQPAEPGAVASAASSPATLAAVPEASVSPRSVGAPIAAETPIARPAASPAPIGKPKRPLPIAGPAEAPGGPESPRAIAKMSAPAGAAPPHRHPYNIQIEAVMDRSGADQMVSRLRSLGYNSYEVPAIIGGQVWYRVRVGPYETEEDAKAAQEKLRAQYKTAYTTH